jgi:uroporphyrinogen decarboxylase
MNSVERVFKALRREEPDRVPIIELEIHEKVHQAILPGATLYEFLEEMEIDGIGLFNEAGWSYGDVAPGIKRDHFGILRDFRYNAGMYFPMPLKGPLESIVDVRDLDLYVPPSPDPRILAPLRDIVEHLKGKVAIIYGVTSSWGYPMYLRGFEQLLTDYYDNPELAHRIATITTDYFVELSRMAIDAGADILLDGDDYCGRTGPYMSPEHFREFVLPGLQRVVDVAKAHKVPMIKHSDGYVWPLLQMIVDTGIDGLNPIEPAAGMDIGEVKRAFGDKVAVIGNIDCAMLLQFGTPEEVREAVRECIRVASPGGGHIICSSNTIHEGVKPENYLAMIKAAKEFGTYPITV